MSDRGRTLPNLKPSDPVRVHYKNSNKLEVKGKVVKKLPQPRSYLVETERGTKVLFNFMTTRITIILVTYIIY